MDKIHRINRSKKNGKRIAVSIPCCNSTIHMETGKKQTNIILLLLGWCLCVLSVSNFRSQLIRIRMHEAIFPEISRQLVKEKVRPAKDRISSLNATLSTMVTSHNKKTHINHSYTKPPIVDFSRQIYDRSNVTSSVLLRSIMSRKRKESNNGGALCIKSDRWYGRTFNRILELANALAIIVDDTNNVTNVNEKRQTFIGLAPNLSEWYETFLDPRNDIVLNYTGPCVSVWSSKDLFFVKEYKNSRKSRHQLQDLVPKKEFREEAEQALASYSKKGQQQVISVHRRHLEGACVKKAMGVSVACVKDRVLVKRTMSTKALLDTCNYDFAMIQNKHKEDLDKNKSVVVLCTDQQVPELDDTFPIRSNYSFPVEAWLMTKSDIHYGNPHSTVDLVVAVWRTGQHRRTHPEECYEEN